MALHVGISNATDDVRLLGEAVSTGGTAYWYLPSKAAPGDTLAIYLEGRGIFAVGTVATVPDRVPDKPGYYGADIASVRWVDPPLSLARLAEQIPDWAWTRYPRSYTTPPAEVQAALSALLDGHSGRP